MLNLALFQLVDLFMNCTTRVTEKKLKLKSLDEVAKLFN